MVVVYQTNLHRTYSAGVLSRACCVNAVLVVFALCFSFFIVYATGGLWIKQNVYLEQPVVTFKERVLIAATGSLGNTYLFTSYAQLNALAGSMFRPMTVTSSFDDVNADNNPDTYYVNVTIPLASGETVMQVQALFLYRCQLSQIARATFECALFVEHSSGVSGDGAFVIGDLAVRQRALLPWYGTVTQFSDSIVNLTRMTTAAASDFPALLTAYTARNLTGELADAKCVWQAGAGTQFTLRTVVRIPQQTLWYKPGFFEVVKMGWVQYLAIFLIVSVFVNAAKAFVFRHQIVPTFVRTDKVPKDD